MVVVGILIPQALHLRPSLPHLHQMIMTGGRQEAGSLMFKDGDAQCSRPEFSP